jgi:lipocalin
MATVDVRWFDDDNKGPIFTGVWYQRLYRPNLFQKAKATNVTAEYSKNPDIPGTALVHNREVVYSVFGRHANEVTGIAKVSGPGKLWVSFDPLHWFKGKYWVLAFKAHDYMFIGGDPNDLNPTQFGWLLTRDPFSDITEAVEKIKLLPHHFDMLDFVPTAHDPPNLRN